MDAPMAQSCSGPPFATSEISCEMRKKLKQEDEQVQEKPVASLPEGPLVEILSRVPYTSLCRFKCVSKLWLALCSAPDIRKRSLQTLSGFFYTHNSNPCFHNLSGRGPPLVDPYFPFLRKSYECVIRLQCCGGLVLCKCWKARHSKESNLVVCNPATRKWIELPPCPIELQRSEVQQYLGFDPAVPSRFVVSVHLWEFEEVTIYSSDTGRWTAVHSGCVDGFNPIVYYECVFLNGTMHFMTSECLIVTMDTEGKVLRYIDIPGNMYSSIGQSQGRLYAWYIDNPNAYQLSVWALEDYDSEKWTLKHTVNILELFGRHCRKHGEYYKMFAIHPDRNLIFLTDGKEKTISYDMDNQEVHVIGISKKISHVEAYIPCFAEWPSDGH